MALKLSKRKIFLIRKLIALRDLELLEEMEEEEEYERRRKRRFRLKKMETPRKVLRNIHMENIKCQSTPLKIPPSPLMKSLGYGTGVNVYRLERSPKCGQMRSPWAIKRICQRARTQGDQVFNTRILLEANILRNLSHPNIVGYRGLQKAADGVDSLALELCHNSLGLILEDRCEDEMTPLPAKNCLKVIFDICKALDYLHNTARILHGDLKSYNILVKGDFEICKLCDFGVSLPLNAKGEVNFKENPTLEYVGTSLWSAPEVLDKVEIIDTKADIFSFGLIVYETIALSPPHLLNIREDDDSKENISEDEVAAGIESAAGTRPPLPEAFNMTEEYNVVVEVFYCCTNEDMEDRPSAKGILLSLEKNNIYKEH